MHIMVGLAFLGMMNGFFYFSSPSFGKTPPAPDIISPAWINSAPLKMEDLRGKVVMVEFWTFGCWNCRNIEPYVKEWQDAKHGAIQCMRIGEGGYEETEQKIQLLLAEMSWQEASEELCKDHGEREDWRKETLMQSRSGTDQRWDEELILGDIS